MNTNDKKTIYAYVCTPENTGLDEIAQYCRMVYKAGYYPICPAIDLALFLLNDVPAEISSAIMVAEEKMKGCACLIVCEPFNKSISNNSDVSIAHNIGIPTTSLAGIIAASASNSSIVSIVCFDDEYGSDCDDTYDFGDDSNYDEGYRDGYEDGHFRICRCDRRGLYSREDFDELY